MRDGPPSPRTDDPLATAAVCPRRPCFVAEHEHRRRQRQPQTTRSARSHLRSFACLPPHRPSATPVGGMTYVTPLEVIRHTGRAGFDRDRRINDDYSARPSPPAQSRPFGDTRRVPRGGVSGPSALKNVPPKGRVVHLTSRRRARNSWSANRSRSRLLPIACSPAAAARNAAWSAAESVAIAAVTSSYSRRESANSAAERLGASGASRRSTRALCRRSSIATLSATRVHHLQRSSADSKARPKARAAASWIASSASVRRIPRRRRAART